METKKIHIDKGEWLIQALNRQGFKNIPSNIVLDKTLPGLGATYAELHSKRNSIIIEPNVPVILLKTEDNPNSLAVWEQCAPAMIRKHFNSTIKYKKFICTPESFSKIRKVANKLGINIYRDYFCLMDECEKFIQDADYRKRITQPIYDFFQFKNKAMVSATPLPMTHPKLNEQGFTQLKVTPTYDYRKDIELIITNSYDATVRKRFASLIDSPCVCIFLNSTDGINKIINSLHLTDYKVFCSKKSVEKLTEREFENVSENLDLPLAKYNFFTCRFFSALDINLKIKPDILMLTNLNEAIHTIIDPFTEAIQIYGRFRNKFENDSTFNSFTHITNTNNELNVKSNEAVTELIRTRRTTYRSIRERHDAESENFIKEDLADEMKSVKFADLLDKNGEINNFCVDNLYNEERVKGYYLSPESLLSAYRETNHFNIYSPAIETIGEDDLLRIKKAKTSTEKRKSITKALEKLYLSYNENPTLDIDYFLGLIKKEDEGEYTIEAYQKIGKNGIENANYKKSDIDKAVKEYDAKTHRFLPDVLEEIKTAFKLNTPIGQEDIKDCLTEIFRKHRIGYKVCLNTIEDYYVCKKTHEKPYTYTLTQFIPQSGNILFLGI